MNFTQEPRRESMMPTNKKGSAGQELGKGTQQIKNFAAETAARPQFQAGIQAGKKGLNNVKRWGLGLFGMDDESPQQLQQQQMPYRGMGGKRRRKSRRKKRTKRRRKSRRKKRRTKRRRKSRRKRRR